MPIAIANRYSDSLWRWLRGDAAPLTDRALSQTISFARIALVAGLVLLHYHAYPNSTVTPFDGYDPVRFQTATFVNSFFLFFFFSSAPLLSMISGWLFFAFEPQGAAQGLRRRIGRRFSSLYVPMVAWNALFLAILVALYARSPDYPLFDAINLRFGDAGWLDYLNALFGITRHPIGFQFWFIRDLFVTVLISPLLWWWLQRAPYVGMAALGAVWMAGHDLLIFFRTDVVFFFFVGGFLRMRRIPLEVGRNAAWLLLAIYVALTVARTLAPVWIDLSDGRPLWLTGATRATRIIGVLACWAVFLQLVATRPGAWIAGYGGFAFFLYAAHFPLIAQVKIVLWRLIPEETDAWMIAHYFASIGVTIAIAMAIGLILARTIPRAFALMNGGRLAL